MVQYHTVHCYHLVTFEDHQHFHHGDRTDSHEDDVHADPSYNMTHTWYNPIWVASKNTWPLLIS